MDVRRGGNPPGTAKQPMGPVRTTLFVVFVAAVFAVVVGAELGVAWAAADAVVCFLLSAAFAFTKRRHLEALSRSAAGLALAFGFLTLTYTWAFLPWVGYFVGGLGHGSAWECVGITAGIGALLTAALWRGQLRRFAELRARADRLRPLAARDDARPWPRVQDS